LGHALTGVALGLRVARISIGRLGPQLLGIRLFNCTVEVRLVPYGGATVVWFKNGADARSRYLWTILCGPIVTMTLILVSLVIAVVHPHGTLAFASLMFATVNLILLVQILIPRKLEIGSRETSSDFLLWKQVRSMPDAEIDDWVFGRFYCEGAD